MAHNKEDSADTLKIAYAILSFLEEEYDKTSSSSETKESLEVAMQCLEKAFGVSLANLSSNNTVSLRNLVLNSSGDGSANDRINATSVPNNLLEIEVDLGDKYICPSEPSDAQKVSAEENKNKGNDEMVAGKFDEALLCYNRAIELDGTKAVYFCNRAATFTKMERYVDALRDCQIACQLHPTYARAYGRMGVIFSQMESHTQALHCYRKATMLEPENESYFNNLRLTLEMIAGGDASTSDGNVDVMNAASSPFASAFNNPALFTVANQILGDPSMQQMVRLFMENIQNQGGVRGNQSMEALLQMGQAIAQQIQGENPLAQQLEDLLANVGAGSVEEQNDNPDL